MLDLTAPAAIDLTTADEGAGVTGKEIPPYTSTWADIAKPFTWFLLSLIAAVMLLPFAFAFRADVKAGDLLDWAKTILPPVTGFGGAVVGYYFGTRGTTGGGSSKTS